MTTRSRDHAYLNKLMIRQAHHFTALVFIFSILISACTFACPLPKDNKNDKEVGDPVSVTTGVLHSSYEDISIPSGRGELSLEITRDSYGYSVNSGLNQYHSFFGEGWTFNYGMAVVDFHGSSATVINEEGKREVYTWDRSMWAWEPPQGNFSTLFGTANSPWTLKRKDGKCYYFDSLGRLTNITDRNGNRINITYSGIIYGRPVTVTDNTGRSLTFSYNAQGLISSITWPNGQATTYTYEHHSKDWGLSIYTLTKVTDPEGNCVTYTYSPYDLCCLFIFEDGIWQLTAVTDSRGNVTSFSYYDESPGSVNYLKTKRITYADGAFESLSYNESLRFTLVTDERGYTTRYDYDKDENVTVVTGPAGNKTTYVYDSDLYDSDFNKIEVIDAKGNSTKYTYDDKGNCESVTDPLSRVSRFTYEPRYSFVKTATDPKGNLTTYYYDYEASGTGRGNLIKITYPVVNGQTPTELFAYNGYGQIIQQTDAKGAITKYEYFPATGYLQTKTSDYGDTTHINSSASFTYDALGNITSVTDPLNRTTTSDYNKIGLVKKSISPAPFNYQTKYTYDGNENLVRIERQLDETGSSWQVVENTYDKRDRLITTKEYLSASNYITTGFGYDPAGNKISQTDPNGNTTIYEYDECNLLKKTIDAEGNQTEYTYYPDNKLRTIKDAKTNITTYEYDDSGWLTKTTYPDTSYEEHTPDSNSNIASKRTRRGDIITYSYDNLNRLTSKTCPSYPAVSYTYDIASRLTSVIASGSEAISYQYDNLNRVLQTTTLPDRWQAGGSKAVSYEYDKAGNRTKLTYPDGSASSPSYITYNYDRLNRLKNIQDQFGQVISQYTYDPLSRRLTLKYRNNTRSVYTYDNLSRLLKKVNRPIGQPIISTFAYTYDAAGNRMTMDERRGTSAPARTNYAYDTIYQIKDVDYPTGYPFPDISYDYDPVGNRTQLSGGIIELYASNNLNQYTQVNAISYSYDCNGNLTNDGINTYIYDYENRLVIARSGSDEAIYSYDPFGRRIKKEVTQNSLLTTQNYIYDGDQIIAEYDRQGNLTKKFIYGPGIDEPICVIATPTPPSGEAIYYYHTDGLGSVTDITDSSGALVEKYAYDIYGSVIIKDVSNNVLSQSIIGNRYMFTGREHDAETGLYYYRARYYDPTIGRFLQTDPVGYSAGINLYAYCSNNPVNFIDPMGLCEKKKKEKELREKLERWLKFNKGVRDSLAGKYGKAGIKEGMGQLGDWFKSHGADLIKQYGSIDVTFNAGTGIVGASGQMSITSSGISGQVGVGWGIGWGVSVTVGANFGNSSGWGITGSVSGGGGWGGTASGTVSQGGSSVNIGGGWGVGAGASITVGYTGEIIQW